VIHLVRWWQHPSAHQASVPLIVCNNLLQRLRDSSRAFGARPNRVLVVDGGANYSAAVEPSAAHGTVGIAPVAAARGCW
jgi:hypothetical protein